MPRVGITHFYFTLHSLGNKGYAVTLHTLKGLRLSVNKGVLCAGVMSNALMIQSIDLLLFLRTN